MTEYRCFGAKPGEVGPDDVLLGQVPVADVERPEGNLSRAFEQVLAADGFEVPHIHGDPLYDGLDRDDGADGHGRFVRADGGWSNAVKVRQPRIDTMTVDVGMSNAISQPAYFPLSVCDLEKRMGMSHAEP